MQSHFDDLAAAIAQLEPMTTAARLDFLVNAAIETSGEFHLPDPGNNWDSQQITLKAHGIFVTGIGRTEVVCNWMLAAQRQVTLRDELRAAEALMRWPGQAASPIALRNACQIIRENSIDATMRAAARDLLTGMTLTDRAA